MRKKPIFILIGTILSAAIAYQQSAADTSSNNRNNRASHNSSSKNGSAKNNSSNAYAKRRYANDEYRKALKNMWTQVYPSSGRTIYCNKQFSTRNRKERKKYVNAEHIFPMSWVAKDLNCGKRRQCQENSAQFRAIESDLHNIYPALINVNKARSNFRFGDVAGEKRQFGTCDFEVNKRKRIAEPDETVRGEVARAILYMAYQYNLSLHEKTEKLMRQWDRQDPPSKEEKRREAVIHKIQGRENPYISRYPFTK